MKKAFMVLAAFASIAALAVCDASGQGFGVGGGAPPPGGRVVVGGGGSFGPGSGSGIPWSPPGAPEPKAEPKPSPSGSPGRSPSGQPSPSGGVPGQDPAPSPSGGSPGQPGPAEPGKEQPKAEDGAEPQLPVKPTILFFARYAFEVRPGVWSSDDEVKATMRYFNEIFREKEIIALAREFICTVADMGKLSSYGKHLAAKADKAPTIVLLDIDRNPLYRTSDPALQWKTLADALRKVLKKADDQAKALAKKSEDSQRVRQARDRVVHIEMREEYNKAMALAIAGKWAQAEKLFRAVMESKDESEFKSRAKNGIREIEAGKLVEEAQKAIRARRIGEARTLLDMAAALNEAEHYSKIAKDLLKSL